MKIDSLPGVLVGAVLLFAALALWAPLVRP